MAIFIGRLPVSPRSLDTVTHTLLLLSVASCLLFCVVRMSIHSLDSMIPYDSPIRVSSHMVAFPVFDHRSTTHGSSGYPSTGVKLVPRKGVTASWTDELNDILSSKKLSAVAACTDGRRAMCKGVNEFGS